ncbi:MarR family winged helix-turn-helix transcriptional regulator [Enterococcus sp. LJL128]|uniref:MarR family winged helix-turn-helix transcriptional regulator n=1 Tax=Enterococcus sp. LJL51 TaxID=3416656 RepID=UPI003CF79C38
MTEYESNFLEKYLYLEGLLHRYFGWKRREQGPHANPHKGQGRILSILKLQPEITQKEMTFLLDMRPQSLGELLNKLEKAGFVTREPAAEDRRVMVVKLTDAGAEEAEKMNAAEEETIFDVLTEEEQEQFTAIIDKLTAAVEAEMPEDAGRRPDMRGFGGFRGHRGGFGPNGMEDFRPGGKGFPGFGPAHGSFHQHGDHRRPFEGFPDAPVDGEE